MAGFAKSGHFPSKISMVMWCMLSNMSGTLPTASGFAESLQESEEKYRIMAEGASEGIGRTKTVGGGGKKGKKLG
jgi:hypothetical protein